MNENIHEFVIGILLACEARDAAKWTDAHRRMRHARLQNVIEEEIRAGREIESTEPLKMVISQDQWTRFTAAGIHMNKFILDRPIPTKED